MNTILTVLAIWCLVSVLVSLFVGRVIALGSRTVIVAACVAGGAASVSAQERVQPDWPAYTVMVAGNVADLWTTRTALASGVGHEGNPVWRRQDIGTLTVVKIGGVVALTGIMRVLETHGHARIAKVLGYVDGGVTLAAAVHNHRIAR